MRRSPCDRHMPPYEQSLLRDTNCLGTTDEDERIRFLANRPLHQTGLLARDDPPGWFLWLGQLFSGFRCDGQLRNISADPNLSIAFYGPAVLGLLNFEAGLLEEERHTIFCMQVFALQLLQNQRTRATLAHLRIV